ncbi:MAG: prepilin-type N-terminal cleavage/methylation domain-containing protein [Lachnospiraceae bacterium]|nr:prepilin-type N-terminal cleavage/methylation domain-containing protein [Candidatus Colinaster scatohippi]
MERAFVSEKKNSGFSIIELITVIAIMAVMFGIGVYTFAMLSGAEAKQGARKTEACLNDIKTGAMSRAGEYMIIRYIEVTDAGKDALAKAGITKSGYYAEKRATTITNASNIVVDYSTDAEYTLIGTGKIAIIVNGGTFTLSKEAGVSNALRIEYNRGNGTFKKVSTGSVSGTGLADTFAEGATIELEKLEFQALTGRGTHYVIDFDAVTSKHTVTAI